MIARTRLLGAAATALTLSLALAGCGTPQAGAAAVVGKTRISVAEVQEGYQQIVPLVGADQRVTQGDILNLLILRPYLLSAAAAQGHGVSLQDAALDVKSTGGSDSATLSGPGLKVWQANLAFAALQRDQTAAVIRATFAKIGADLKHDGVHLNPRYGAGLDYTNFSITAEKPNWLVSKATPTPGATPSP